MREAEAGSLIVIPRQTMGVVYLGRVKRFELFNNPKWLNEERYMQMPKIAGKPNLEYKNKLCPLPVEVAQGWSVDSWKKVSITLLPRWLQGKLNQQNVSCRIRGYEGIITPSKIFSDLINGNKLTSVEELNRGASDDEIYARLLERVGPTDFEFLVRDLMICDQPELHWETGGKLADGGVDVAGFDKKTMEAKVLIQCKWQWDEEVIQLEIANTDAKKKLFVLVKTIKKMATLSRSKSGTEYFDHEKIVRLVRRHAKSIPFLRSIGLPSIAYAN